VFPGGTYLVDKILHFREKFRVLARALCQTPAEKNKPVIQGRGQETPASVGRDVDVVVSLAQLLARIICEKADVEELWWRPLERIIQSNVLGGRDEPFLRECISLTAMHFIKKYIYQTYSAPDDMGNFHQVIVDYIRKVVRGESIALDEDKVVFLLLLLVPAINTVYKGESISTLEPDDMGFSLGRSLGRLFRGYVSAGARVPRRLVLRYGLCLVLFQVLGRTETAVGLSGFKQLVGERAVLVKPLRLPMCKSKVLFSIGMTKSETHLSIRAIWAANIRTCPALDVNLTNTR
jgi:hypothetical protein